MINKFMVLVVCLVFFFAGCASSPKVTDTHSGFLTDYSKLKESDNNTASYEAEGYDPRNYGKIIFAPIVVQLSPQLLENSGLEATRQKELSQYVTDELNRRLSAGFSGKGTGTLKIRAAVSGIAKTNKELAGWQYLPVTLVATGAMEATGRRKKALVLFFETEAIDVASGEIVAAKVRASELGQVDNAAFESDPIKVIKPSLDIWLRQLMLDINREIQ